jgi:catechol 2,3-dioxygenase-like lactoylglutathione lyase family enzyme
MSIPFHSLVPLMHVRGVPVSTAFYEKLGFRVVSSHKEEPETEISWAFLQSGGAALMLARATAPVIAGEQAVILAMYVPDVEAKHREIVAAGISPGPVEHPFFRPKGHFRIEDPDGYVINVTYPER